MNRARGGLVLYLFSILDISYDTVHAQKELEVIYDLQGFCIEYDTELFDM